MEELGFSDCMGPALRAFVEGQLVADLQWYMPSQQTYQRSDVKFDWSDSCVEGHRTRWLDGEIENFSGIAVLHNDGSRIADGWMAFIETEDGLEVFWWYIAGADQHAVRAKDTDTVPPHVWNRLSAAVRALWQEHAPTHALT